MSLSAAEIHCLPSMARVLLHFSMASFLHQMVDSEQPWKLLELLAPSPPAACTPSHSALHPSVYPLTPNPDSPYFQWCNSLRHDIPAVPALTPGSPVSPALTSHPGLRRRSTIAFSRAKI